MRTPTPLERYRELAARVDAFFARVTARHGHEMQCRPGCDACCRVHPGIPRGEAAEITALVRSLAPGARARLAARAEQPRDDRCPALEDDGRCAVYAARPLVCRSHGVPVRMRDARSLPVVSSCHLNFVARGPQAADADCVLDQETLSTILHAVDAAYAREAGVEPGERVELARAILSGA